MTPRNTYHRDGTVTYWDVYAQTWRRTPATAIRARILASMSERERTRIARLAARYADRDSL